MVFAWRFLSDSRYWASAHMCSLAICVSSREKDLSKRFVRFLIGSSVFVVELQVFSMDPGYWDLIRVTTCRYFSRATHCVLTLLITSFDTGNFVILTKSSLQFVVCAFGITCQETVVRSKVVQIDPVFPSKSFAVLAPVFRSPSSSEFIFVRDA